MVVNANESSREQRLLREGEKLGSHARSTEEFMIPEQIIDFVEFWDEALLVRVQN
jgi:hypothetical protein